VWYLVVAVGVLGLGWRFNPGADSRLAGRLWPVAVIGVPAVGPAAIWVILTVAVVWILETPFSLLAHRGVAPIGPTVTLKDTEDAS
jgi:hypothetical protein